VLLQSAISHKSPHVIYTPHWLSYMNCAKHK
jgi:hypothetical protein